jgi:hypothetical protein
VPRLVGQCSDFVAGLIDELGGLGQVGDGRVDVADWFGAIGVRLEVLADAADLLINFGHDNADHAQRHALTIRDTDMGAVRARSGVVRLLAGWSWVARALERTISRRVTNHLKKKGAGRR